MLLSELSNRMIAQIVQRGFKQESFNFLIQKLQRQEFTAR